MRGGKTGKTQEKGDYGKKNLVWREKTVAVTGAPVWAHKSLLPPEKAEKKVAIAKVAMHNCQRKWSGAEEKARPNIGREEMSLTDNSVLFIHKGKGGPQIKRRNEAI